MKTIELNGIKYQIKDYISAPDMVGLNIFSLFALAEKLGKSDDQRQTLQVIIDNMGELTKLVQRIVITPKLEDPKMAIIIGLFLNSDFMASFTESFEGLTDLMDTPVKNE